MTEIRNPDLATRHLWMAAFAACALWLVIQNSMLVIGFLWARPAEAVVVTSALIKVASLLIGGFWTSAVAGSVLVGVLGLAAGAVLPSAHGR